MRRPSAAPMAPALLVLLAIPAEASTGVGGTRERTGHQGIEGSLVIVGRHDLAAGLVIGSAAPTGPGDRP